MPESPRTLATQKLEALIEQQSFPQDRLPGVRELGTLLGVSKNTVVEILEHLKDKGLITSKPRVGFFLKRNQSPKLSLSENTCCKSLRFIPGVSGLNPEFALTDVWKSHILAWQKQQSPLGIVRQAPCDGEPTLREAIAYACRPHGSGPIAPDSVVITPGATLGLLMAAAYAMNRSENRIIAVEAPSFLPFEDDCSFLHGVKTVPLLRTEHGLALHDLKAIPAAIVLAPDLQNPMGTSYTLSERFRIASWAQQNKVLILENATHSLFPQGSEPLPSFYALCPENTILTASFSKILGEGVRVGWQIGTPEYLHWISGLCNRACGAFMESQQQLLVASFLEASLLGRHLQELHKTLARVATMGDALSLPEGSFWAPWQGGLYRRLLLPITSPAERLALVLRSKGLYLRPDSCFLHGLTRTENPWLRFNLSECNNGTLIEMIKILQGELASFR